MKRIYVFGGLLLVALFAGWLVRGVGRAQEAARRSTCTGHLKWAAVSLLNYHSQYGSFPAATIPNAQLPPELRLSWVVEMWNTQSIGVTINVDRLKSWNDSANWPPRLVVAENMTLVDMKPEDMTDWVICPDDPGSRVSNKPYSLTYVGIAGVGIDAPALPAKHPRAGVFGYDRATRQGDITDGTSNTLLLAETTLGHGPWTAGGPASVRAVDTTAQPYIGHNRPFGGYHPGGANVAIADGSVRFIRDTIAPPVFEAISTIAGGESMPADWTR